MQNLYLALQWYQHGQPTWEEPDGTQGSIVDRIDHDLLGDLWRGIEAERDEHREQANAYATDKTGYSFDPQRILSDDHEAYTVLAQLEYERLEAAAAERRTLALAACIK